MNPPNPVVIEWLRNIKAHELFDVLRPLWSLEKLFDLAYHIDPGGQECDADHGNCAVKVLGHGVLLVFGAPCQIRHWRGRSTAGPFH
jgi:hypothetical protein